MDLKDKIKELKKQGYSNAQSYAIANAIKNSKKYAQQSIFDMGQTLEGQAKSPQQDFSGMTQEAPPKKKLNWWEVDYLNQPQQFPQQFPEQREQAMDNTITMSNEEAMSGGYNVETKLPQSEINRNKQNYKQGVYDNSGIQYNDINRTNIYNPYGGYDSQQMAWMSGQYFGQGRTGMGIAAGAGSALGFARNFLSGMGSGREMQRSQKEANDRLYNPNPTYSNLQQGGKIKNSEYLTGEFAVEEGQGNINAEGGEYIKRMGGNVQEIVGEPHLKNGKIAEGVNVNLQEGESVLSDYTKYTPENIKLINENYNLKLKKGATPADAQKTFDKKLGIKKATAELTQYIEESGKNALVKDEVTRKLNQTKIDAKTAEYKDRLDTLKMPQSQFYDYAFALQESQPKIGDGTQLLDKKGNPVTEYADTEVAQQGRMQGGDRAIELANKYGITPQRAQELLMQQGGMQEQPQEEQTGGQEEQIMQMIAQALQQGTDPQEIMQQLLQMGVPQEVVQQMIQGVMQQMQGAEQEMQGGEQQMQSEEQQMQGGEQEMAQQGIRYAQQSLTNQGNGFGNPFNLPQREYSRRPASSYTQNQTQSQRDPLSGLNPYARSIFQGIQPTSASQPEYLKKSVATRAALPTIPSMEAVFATSNNNTQQMMQEQPIMVDGQVISINGEVATQTATSPQITSDGKTVNSTGANNFTNSPRSINTLPYTPISDVTQDIWKGDNYGGKWKPLVAESMSDPTKAKKIEDWLMSSNSEFSANIKNQLEGLVGDARKQRIIDLATDGKPGLFHNAFLDALKVIEPEKPVAEEAKAVETVEDINRADTIENRETTSTVMPWLPQKMFLPPSPGLSPFMGQVSLERMTPIKGSVEPYLANTERNRQTSAEMIRQSGLSPQQAQALIASGLSDSQMADNDAISRVENFNMQSQAQADNFNIGQRAKEDLTNEQYKNLFSDKATAMRDNYDRDLRSFYNDVYMDNANKFQYIDDINVLNAKNSNYQVIPGQGVQFLNNRPVKQNDTALNSAIEKLTPAQRKAYLKRKAKGEDSYEAINKVVK